jgi:uncharacterized membrane protein YfcA
VQAFALETLGLAAVILTLGGLVAGVAGFGFALVATGLLASLVDPTTAVVVLIVPLLAANASLVGELDGDGLRSCVRRFWPYVVGAALGTVVGMALLSQIPRQPVTLALGLLTLTYVGLSQRAVTVPGLAAVADRCFVEGAAAKSVLGFVSGVVFGATNVGVQVVAYLRSLDLDRSTFVGVVAMVFLGVSALRVIVAGVLGLYPDLALFGYSLAAVVPALVGVAAGRRLRSRIPPRTQRLGVFLLLTVVGVRLTLAGAGV